MTLRGYSEDVVELTPRMRAVLRAAAAGKTERETARELGVAFATVKTERAAALARLGARNVVQAVAIVASRGEL